MAPVSAERPVAELLGTAGELVDGQWYYRECRRVADSEVDLAGFFQFQAVPQDAGGSGAATASTPPSAQLLAQQAYDRVPLPLPQGRTSPPADGEVLVGFPIWLWIDPGVWRSFTAQAAVPGLSVSVTATPSHVTWDMGDGAQVTCTGPGTPWDPADGGQRSDCTHAYQFVSADQPGERYRVTVTVVWAVTWEASSGESGTLPDATRTSGFPLEVTERQAVISHPR